MKSSTAQHGIDLGKVIFFLLTVVLLLLLVTVIGKGQNRSKAVAVGAAAPQAQQPLYTEYRGIHLGMTPAEVRAKLGEPAMKSDEQDFYIFSTNESAQIGYEGQKVTAISADYVGGVGAPDYKNVVGENLLQKPDGSLFRMSVHTADRYWVSYNKSAAVVPVVTITIGTLK